MTPLLNIILSGGQALSDADSKDRPIRDVIFTRDEMAEHGRRLAEEHEQHLVQAGGKALLRQFLENAKFIRQAYFLLAEAAKEKEPLTPGAEWLLDNYHIVEDQVRDIRRHLPKSYYRELPKLAAGAYEGYPRVYCLAFEMIGHTDAVVDSDKLGCFVHAYQERLPLSIGELWAFPIMLRLALIENLRRLSIASLRFREQAIVAERVIESVLVKDRREQTEILIELAQALQRTPQLLADGVVHVLRLLRGRGPRVALALKWVEERIREQSRDPEALMQLHEHGQAANQISIGNTFISLKTVGAENWRDWFEAMSVVDSALRKDPAAVYGRSDFVTRDAARRRVEWYARRLKLPESRMANLALALAVEQASAAPRDTDRAPGDDSPLYYLIGRGRALFERRAEFRPSLTQRLSRMLRRRAWPVYAISAFLLLGVLLSYVVSYAVAAGASPLLTLLAVLLATVPLSDLALSLLQWTITHVVPPEPLPKLDYDDGVPESARTVVTVHAIFSDKELIDKVVDGIEVRFLGNEDRQIFYALLADLFDAGHETTTRDKNLVEHAQLRIAGLNKKYGTELIQPFMLMFRSRSWNESQRKFIGWERKRGKIEEFNRFLQGDETTSLQLLVGHVEDLRGCRYVLTLDADTRLTRGTARKMIGTIAHPLNAPVFDERRRVVVQGFGIIQPRVGVTLESANESRFARVFCGVAGLDPYTGVVSEVYQDFFGEGSFVGKAIYCPRTFEKALRGRVPENTLLSHDLFEGNHARVGLASDLELLDDFPGRFDAFTRRDHRWVRGDWQLLPWVWPRVRQADGTKIWNPMSGIGHWKLVDNLRRSLIAPATVVLLATAWIALPGSAVFWTALVLAVLAFPVFANVATVLMVPDRGASIAGSVRGLGRDTLRQLQQTALTLAFLPFEAWLMLHAIVTTVFRVIFTGRRLLEWQTAHQAEQRSGSGLVYYYRFMLPGVLIALAVASGVWFLAPQNIVAAFPVLLLWIAAPGIAEALSRPEAWRVFKLNSNDEQYLRTVAWETWSYFDQLLIPEYNYLIPDNVQLVPDRLVAPRTSPTNVGLSILAVLSAYDLGFLPLVPAIERLRKVYDGLLRLERVHGHFLNWYDCASARPLLPRYVSTVDSGNLVGHLIAARTVFEQAFFTPIVQLQHLEHLNRLREISGSETVVTPQPTKGTLNLRLIQQLVRDSDALAAVKPREVPDAASGNAQIRHDLAHLAELAPLVGWIDKFDLIIARLAAASVPSTILSAQESLTKILGARSPTLSLLAKLQRRTGEYVKLIETEAREIVANDLELRSALAGLREELEALNQRLLVLTAAVEALIDDSTKLIKEADFAFLYDSHKQLFVIGHNLDLARRDPSYYDLLASEARLASLVAIAKGDVPQKHWFMLGRSLADTPGGRVLMSWSGTMFEYLMPLLVTLDYPSTLLAQTHRAVVRAQRIYGRRRGVPWGISESAYSGVDFEKNYQYRAFGVPGLGLKRGLSEDLVVSPYSTMLALPIDPSSAVRNLRRLERLGMRGEHGFFEAVDYTTSRLTSDERYHIVRSFLAHHQGMSIVALNNFLNQGVIQRRFHADPLIRATDLLLQEKFPDRAQLTVPNKAELSLLERQEEELRTEKTEVILSPHTEYPLSRLISNGRYSVIVDNGGGGSSFFDRDLAITRWREDAVTDDNGHFIFLRDLDSKRVWSAAYQPTRVEPETYEVVFNPDKVEFKRKDFGLGVHTEITVSPEDQIEVRRVTITNVSQKKRNVELTSFFEVVLGSAGGDLAHPAFSKMFVQSEHNPNFDALIFSRRPRSVHDKPLWLFHMMTMPVCWDRGQFESARDAFIGRGRTIHDPQALQGSYDLSGSVGLVLDPVAALRTRLEVEPGRAESVTFVTGIAESRDEILHLAQRYHELQAVSRAFEMAWSKSNVELRHQHFTIAQSHTFQHLANALVFNIPHVRGRSDMIAQNRLTQSGFWRFGVSGDLPIVVVRVNDPAQAKLVQEVLLAHEYLRRRGLAFDLVIINEYPGGYLQNFQNELDALIHSGFSGHMVDRPGGVYLRTAHQLAADEQMLLRAVARVVLDGEVGSMAAQLKLVPRIRQPSAGRREAFSYIRDHEYSHFSPPVRPIEFENGSGGFVENGRAYQLIVQGDKVPPLPWSNVIANPDFGFLTTESGGGYTWAGNSRENRLTPWSNDPVSDPAGEVIYLRDAVSGAYWSATPRPVSGGEAYRVTHGFGFSEYVTQRGGIFSSLRVALGANDPVKCWHLKVSNGDYVERKIELYLYVDLVLGIVRGSAARQVVTSFDVKTRSIIARNSYNNEFASRISFISSTRTPSSFTTKRQEFVGRHRDLSCPDALEQGAAASLLNLIGAPRGNVVLSGSTGAGIDPCGVLQLSLTLAPGEEQEVIFTMGQGRDTDEAVRLAGEYRSMEVALSRIETGLANWREMVSTIEVRSPDRSFDIMVNGWLLYQTVACRLWGRSGFYQSGGAFGFRDQLQDALALLYIRPELAREQIILHASRQFLQGDAQHWWHPPTGRGVRTRISDDYLWLPFAVHRYLEVTGDQQLLELEVPFLEGPPLEEGREDSYLVPEESAHRATIYEHCLIAIDRALNFGAHGLPFIGSGDWNDGMNEVGREGRGESVWLGWFIYRLLVDFEPLLKRKNDNYRATQYRAKREALRAALHESGWDGEWYRRAYFDDGTPLGSSTNDECQIDSLSQSWSVISGAGDPERSRQAMESAEQRLVGDNIIRLLTPPFDQGKLQPGYIKGYLPGIRENGAQYTHAASWVVLAAALQGRGTRAMELWRMLNPINHTDTPEGVDRYKGEPYVLCGDVYSVEPFVGRAGWSWYSGSAAWLYRVAVEDLLGLKLSAAGVTVAPCIPTDWPEFSMRCSLRGCSFEIKVVNPDRVERGVREVRLDGVPTAETVPWSALKDGVHTIEVTLGA